jgi:hypothetical protein
MQAINTKKCLICKEGRKNDSLHWHQDAETKDIWVYCVGKCQRGYSIYQYVALSGLKLNEFLKGDFHFVEAKPGEVNKMEWSSTFIPMSDPRAQPGVDYVRSRGLDVGDGMYYDTWRKGIVFPHYYQDVYCGAQIRLIDPWIDDDGQKRKVDTLPGTRLGLLFYGWNQGKFLTNVKGLIVTEGAFNAIAIQQALNHVYGGIVKNPWKVVASSGSGISAHKVEVMKGLKEEGIKIILAPDSDEAGVKMLKKCAREECITHYNFTNEEKYDWNDVAQALGKEEFAKRFLGSIKRV